jgi:hypothetical protein
MHSHLGSEVWGPPRGPSWCCTNEADSQTLTAEHDLVVPILTPLTRGYENLLVTGYERFDDNNNDLGFNASRWASAPRQQKRQTAPFILRKYLDLLEADSEASHRIMKEKRRFLFLSIDLSKLSKPVIDAMNVLDRLIEAVFIFTNDFKDLLKPQPYPFLILK